MSRLDDTMARFVDERAFFLRVGSPEDEDEIFAFGGKGVDDGVGEDFPALALVGSCLVGFDG